MINLDELHEDFKNMSIPNEKIVSWIVLLSNELRATRKVVEAARKYASAKYVGAVYNEWEQFTNALKELDGENDR